MIRGAVFAAIAWIGLTCVSVAQTLTFPALTGRVVDQAGLLSAPDQAQLTSALADLEAKTRDQLVVVTLKSLQGTTIEDFGYQLGRQWQIGQKDKNSGALLIIAPAEHRARIEVGYGLEGTLTDATTKRIIETSILPAFRTGDFPGGIKAGTGQIIQLLIAEAGIVPGPAPGSPAATQQNAGTPVGLIVVLGVFGVGMLVFCAVRGGAVCRAMAQILFMMALSGRGGSSRGRSSPYSGGGGSFGGGGSSGSW